MIEDELRALLTDRAGELPDNPTRVTEVRSRVRRTRRRRTAGAALSLVLLALAGFGLTRLPGSPDALPTGVPPGPWFTENGRVAPIPGYSPIFFPRELSGPADNFVQVGAGDFRYLVVVRCQRAGELTMRNLVNGRTVEVDCSRRVGDHFEGAAVINPAEARTMLDDARGLPSGNVRFEPGAPGQEVALLQSNDADRLSSRVSIGRPWLAEGTRTRQGTTVEITVPAKAGPDPSTVAMSVAVECVAGVRLVLSVPTGELGTVDCDPTRNPDREITAMRDGKVQIFVADQELARLGLRAGDRVPLTIRSVGRDTDQWRVYPLI